MSSTAIETRTVPLARPSAGGAEDPPWVRRLLIGLTFLFLAVFIVLPAVNVFVQAFAKGYGYYAQTFFAPKPAGKAPAVAEFSNGEMSQQEAEEKFARAIAPWRAYESAEKNRAAVKLTLLVVAVVVPLNAIFGLAAAWAVTRFKFPGRALLISLIDLPFSVSPVVSGLIFVLLFGAQGILVDISLSQRATWLTPAVASLPYWGLALLELILISRWIARMVEKKGKLRAALRTRQIGLAAALAAALGILIYAYASAKGAPSWAFLNPGTWKIPDLSTLYWRGFSHGWWPIGARVFDMGVIDTPLAVVIATAFVTFPFVARTLIPVMSAGGSEEEVAALSLGANGWQMFRRVTIPNVKWGLFYGLILCTARACGEFGAASVVGPKTDGRHTMPLRIEDLWVGSNIPGAFAMASLLTMLAVVTLGAKAFIEWRMRRATRAPVKTDEMPAQNSALPIAS